MNTPAKATDYFQRDARGDDDCHNMSYLTDKERRVTVSV